MYTLVLMTAMAGAPDAAGFGGRLLGGGSCYSACYGTSCVGASYASCAGCCGGFGGCCGGYYAGPLFPRLNAFAYGLGGRARAAFAPAGTYACYGCCGGCCGGVVLSGCCGGCTGVYSGSAVYGGCYGSAVPASYFGCSGCHGCSGCFGCAGGPVVIGGLDLPAVPAAPGVPTVEVTSFRPAGDPAAATLVVSLPAAARLYVDGVLVPGDGPARRFHTPPLAAGQGFFYELKAELLVGGKVEAEETKVVIRAGDSKDIGFPKLVAAARTVSDLAAR